MLLTWISRFGFLAYVLLIAVMTVFVAAFGAVVAGWGERRGRGVVAVVAWSGIEVVRSTFPLGGFPWGVLGATQHAGGPLLPAGRLGGVVLVGMLTASLGVAAEALIVGAWRWYRRRDIAGVGGLVRGELIRAAVFAVVPLAVVALVPAVPVATSRTLDVAAVQGNDIELPPTVDRLNRVRIERVVERMVHATERIEGTPDLVVWPENSLDSDYRDDPALGELVADARAAIDGAPLIAGTLLDGPRSGTAYNSLVVIGDDEEIVQTYRKRKLVPFGEYVPARRWLGWIPALQQVPIDYLPGEGPGVFSVEGASGEDALVGPVTCFESVFSGVVLDQVRAGAEMLVVSTNNASFGRTAASRQHLAFSQLRAVETGRWVVHAGISGISALVDPTGDVSQRTELFRQAIVRADVPLVTATTPALWLAPVLSLALVIGLAGIVVLLSVARLRGRHGDPTRGPVSASAVEEPVAR